MVLTFIELHAAAELAIAEAARCNVLATAMGEHLMWSQATRRFMLLAERLEAAAHDVEHTP